jgi:hypothetical protein
MEPVLPEAPQRPDQSAGDRGLREKLVQKEIEKKKKERRGNIGLVT